MQINSIPSCPDLKSFLAMNVKDLNYFFFFSSYFIVIAIVTLVLGFYI